MRLSTVNSLPGLQHPTVTQVARPIQSKTFVRRQLPKFIPVLGCLALIMLTSGTAHATFPGRNGLIAFQAQTEEGIQIFTVRPNGQDLKQITHLDGDSVTPDWSPDGRQIVFEHDAPGACAKLRDHER